MRWTYAMPVCVLCVSSRSGIVFNPSAGAIIDHSQSAKDIDPHFKSQLYVKDPDHRKPVLILQKWPSKPGERAHDRNSISAVVEIRTHNLLIDSRACYHGAITTLSSTCQHVAIHKGQSNFQKEKLYTNNKSFNQNSNKSEKDNTSNNSNKSAKNISNNKMTMPVPYTLQKCIVHIVNVRVMFARSVTN